MVMIEFNNRTKYNFPRSAVLRALNDASKILRIKGKQTLSVAFVDKDEIKKLNKRYRRENKITDVLSFEAGTTDCLGEIIICPAQAKKQAKEFKQSYQKEIIKLVLHGYLHVIGFDHEKEVEAREMEKLERRVLGYGA